VVLGLEGVRLDHLRRQWSSRDGETWRFHNVVPLWEGSRRFDTWRKQMLRVEVDSPRDRGMMRWVCQGMVVIPLVELDGWFGGLLSSLL
jgi:hypothetical protein